MNKKVINEKVVEEWMDSKDRKTVVFCSTIVHAQDVLQELVKVRQMVTSETSKEDRKDIHMNRFGDIGCC